MQAETETQYLFKCHECIWGFLFCTIPIHSLLYCAVYVHVM